LAGFWETSAKAFSALIALASAALAALSAEVLAASASLRALEVALILDSKEATHTRALARETTDTMTTQKIDHKQQYERAMENNGNKDMYPWIHRQSFESRDIRRQEIGIYASKAAEQKCISKATRS
jgi:hypothetical protein